MNNPTTSVPSEPQKLTEDQRAALVDAWKGARRLLLEGCLAPLPLETTLGALAAIASVEVATRGQRSADLIEDVLASVEVPQASVGPWIEIDNGWARRSKVGEWRLRVLRSSFGFKWEVFGPNGRVDRDVVDEEQEGRDAADASARTFGVALG